MKKVLLIGGKSYNPRDQVRKQNQLVYMSDVLGESAECFKTFFDDIRYEIAPGSFEVYDTRNMINLTDIDVVFIRGLEEVPPHVAYYISRYCAWSGKICVSDYSRYAPQNKVAQAVLFLEHGVPFLRTIYSEDGMRLIAEAEQRFGYPFILKDILGLRGDHNYLVHSRHEAEQALAADTSVSYLAQEYCPNDCDYRLLIMGEDYMLFERRGSSDSHLNNTSKGAQATLVDNVLPPSIVQQSFRLAKSLGIMVAGVDVMPNRETGEHYFLEVNLQPQLRTGAFPDEKRALMRKMFDSF